MGFFNKTSAAPGTSQFQFQLKIDYFTGLQNRHIVYIKAWVASRKAYGRDFRPISEIPLLTGLLFKISPKIGVLFELECYLFLSLFIVGDVLLLGSFLLDKISSFLKWVPVFLWDLWWVGGEITFWFMVCVFLSIFENPSSGCWFASFCFCPFGWCMAVILCFWLLHIFNSILLRGDSCANPSLIFFVFELYYFWVKVWMMPVMY